MSKEITIKGQTEIATTSHNDAMLSMIERLATDPNADIEKLERMLDMQERIFNKNAETAYNSAMSIAQNEIGPIVKNKENKFNNSRYADIDAIHDKAKPVWTKHGFSVSSTVYMAEKDGYVGIKTTVRHAGGHKEEYSNEWPLDGVGAQGKANKTAIQAIGSTATYARRYSEMMIFDIAIAEHDRDGAPLYGTQTMEVNLNKAAIHAAGSAETYTRKRQKQQITDERLANAMKKINSGEYTFERLENDFEITDAQRKKFNMVTK